MMFEITSSVAQQTGQRHLTSEDRYICNDIFDSGLSLYAVCDGHGDALAAEFVKVNLPKYLMLADGFAEKNYVLALRNCISRLHTELVTEAHSKGGTTLSLALIDRQQGGHTILAFLGDSPIFVRRRHIIRDDVYLAFPLHNSSNPAIAYRNQLDKVATPPWETKRHSRGINLYASIGDALYEPSIANNFLYQARQLATTLQKKDNTSESKDWLSDDSKQQLKHYLENAFPDTSPEARHARLHTSRTLSFYVSDKASLLEDCPLQREPDIMSIPTVDIDLISIGSDGAFPQSCFDKIMTVIRKVSDASAEDCPSRLAKRLMSNDGKDDKTVLVIAVNNVPA